MTVNKPEKFKLGLAAILAAAKTDAINIKEKKFNPKFDSFYEEFVKEHSPEKNDDDTLRTIILGNNVKEDEALPNPKDFGIKDEDKQKIKEAYDNYLRKVGGYKAVFESEIKEDIAWLKDLEERFKEYDWSWLAKIKFEDKPEAETSVSKPKREDLKHELEKYEIFSKEYSSIDETQFIHNEVYFSNRSLSLENEYDGLFSSNRFIGHHEIKPFYLRWFQIVDDFFGSPAIFRGRLSKDSAQTIHEERQI